MCGVAGIISPNPNNVTRDRLQTMADTLVHRGPQGEGFWLNEKQTVGFAHRRLCIIDLSEGGAQPMHYLDRYTITYNGELYNYVEIKDQLLSKGFTFSTASDTEVILASYAYYGSECLQYFDGMFAFAIWDKQEQVLFCARDRFGEKPFYYFDDGKQFLFASEMKALWSAGVDRTIDNTLLLNYISLGLTANPTDLHQTFYSNISKIPAAHFLELKLSDSSFTYSVLPYWHLDKETVIDIKEDDAIEKFAQLFHTSIKRRLRSDVAVGTSLSGGLDSSSIVATMQSYLTATNSSKAFSAVFPGFEKDESEYINTVTNQFNLTGYTVTPTADDFIKDFEKLAWHQEQPFQSSSIYAQYKVYELAKQKRVTVLLDGQGADETIGGYHKYYHWYWQELISNFKWQTAKDEIQNARSLNVSAAWGVKNYLSAFLPGLTAQQLQKKAYNKQRECANLKPDFIADNFNQWSLYKPVVDKLNDILYFNTMQLGLEELLHYADRNSMAHSREVRLPFLNHELVQFVFSLPSSFKIKQGWTKWILRKSIAEKLPAEITWRKNKVGFEPPQKQWLQHPKVQEYMQESRRVLVGEGILKASVLNTPLGTANAHEEDNFDWRYLSAASCIKPLS